MILIMLQCKCCNVRLLWHVLNTLVHAIIVDFDGNTIHPIIIKNWAFIPFVCVCLLRFFSCHIHSWESGINQNNSIENRYWKKFWSNLTYQERNFRNLLKSVVSRCPNTSLFLKAIWYAIMLCHTFQCFQDSIQWLKE